MRRPPHSVRNRKPCRICEHPEHVFLSQLLLEGVSPRAIKKRVGGVGRNELAHHRDRCLRRYKREPSS